jgi:hypothetical protein
MINFKILLISCPHGRRDKKITSITLTVITKVSRHAPPPTSVVVVGPTV